MDQTVITSRDNERLKNARRVRDGRDRDRIFVEGIRLFEEAVRSDLAIERVFVTPETAPRIRDLLKATGAAEIVQVTDQVFASVADTVRSQGVAAIAARPQNGREQLEPIAGAPLLLLLHEINNPSNLGAVLRTAEAAGATGAICTSGSADPFSAKALRSAMGSAFRLPIWTGATFADVIEWARAAQIRTIATDVTGGKSYLEADLVHPTMIVMGSEAHGLSKVELDLVDEVVVIPMASKVESLNLAVAAGVLLFEARRQRDEA